MTHKHKIVAVGRPGGLVEKIGRGIMMWCV